MARGLIALLLALSGFWAAAQTSSSLEAQGDAFFKDDQYRPAIQAFSQALAAEGQSRNPSELTLATLNLKLGVVYSRVAEVRTAEPLLEKALEVRKRVYGSEHPLTAEVYVRLGQLYGTWLDTTKAVFFHCKALEVYNKTLPQDHLDRVDAMLFCGISLASRRFKGDTARAEQLVKEAVAIREKAYGSQHPETASAYNFLGIFYTSRSTYQQASQWLNKAVEVFEKTLGSDHRRTANVYNDLSSIARITDRYQLALQYSQKALRVYVRLYGEEGYWTATVYEKIASIYRRMGNYTEVWDLLEKVRASYTKHMGEVSTDMAYYYQELAYMYLDLYDQRRAADSANKAFQTAYAFYEQEKSDTNRFLLAMTMVVSQTWQTVIVSSRESVKDDRDDYHRTLLRFRATYEQHLEPDAIEIQIVDDLLADIDAKSGEYASAVQIYLRKLEQTKGVYGVGSMIEAELSLSIGEFERLQKNYGTAQVYLSRAIAIRKKIYGEDHPEVREALRELARLRLDQGNLRGATELFRQIVQENTAANMSSIYNVLDTAGINRYNFFKRLDIREYASLLLKQGQVSPALRNEVMGFWLTQKGTSAALGRSLAVLSREGGEAQAYQRILEELGGHLRTQPESQAPAVLEAWRSKTMALNQQKSELERRVAARSAVFKTELGLRQIQPLDLQKHLKPGEVYLDFIFTVGQITVFTLKPVGAVGLYEVLDGNAIRSQIREFRKQLEAGKSLVELQPLAHQLYKNLVQGFAADLQTARKVIVSTDGLLNQLPFELLHDGRQWLLERFAVSYVPSGRDWLRLNLDQASTALGPAAVFGNPAFDSPVAPLSATREIGEVNLGQLLSLQQLPPLPGSELEAKGVAALLGDKTQLFLGQAANEQNLTALKSPKVLHIATHGFAIQTGNPPSWEPNALQYSGIALSGARVGVTEGEGRGVISGLQLSRLNLEGTELVVLSACDTALTEETLGESALGLNQAFLSAGAKRVMLSLWKVPDQETADFMQVFYRRWLAGNDTAVALRETKLEMMKKGQSPKAWAAFVLSGK